MNKKGFTLTEIMITVVVIGILAAIAVPMYTGYMTRTRRAEAVSALETVALYEEKVFAETNAYTDLAGLIARGFTDPNASATRNYTIVINATATTFVARATPAGAQASDTIVFAIDNNGNRGTLSAVNTVTTNTQLWNSLRP